MSAPEATNTAASGYRVDFHAKPWRHYTICLPGAEPERVPSVTQAIGVYDKSAALQHYASNKTLEGIATIGLEHRGRLPGPAMWGPLAGHETRTERIQLAADMLKGSLRKRRLMFYDRTKDAQDRGLALHTIFEDWAEREKIPVASDHPEEYRGYIRSLAGWLAEHRPEFLVSEVVVGSARHMYGGRMDTALILRSGDGSRGLVDLKTSRACYPRSQFVQLQAYEYAHVEMGGEPTDWQAVLRVDAGGGPAQLCRSEGVTFDHFRLLLETYRAFDPLPESLCTACAAPTKRGKCPKGCPK